MVRCLEALSSRDANGPRLPNGNGKNFKCSEFRKAGAIRSDESQKFSQVQLDFGILASLLPTQIFLSVERLSDLGPYQSDATMTLS